MTYPSRADLYHEIQKRCTHPAYFWYNYRSDDRYKTASHVPFEGLRIEYQLEWLPSHAQVLMDRIRQGDIDPQAWCDNNLG